MSAPVVSVQEVTKQYHMGDTTVHALRGVSLQVAAGAFVATRAYYEFLQRAKADDLLAAGHMDMAYRARAQIDRHFAAIDPTGGTPEAPRGDTAGPDVVAARGDARRPGDHRRVHADTDDDAYADLHAGAHARGRRRAPPRGPPLGRRQRRRSPPRRDPARPHRAAAGTPRRPPHASSLPCRR